MKIRWTLPALADLNHESDFIAQENPQAAKRVFQKIRKSVQDLTHFPEMGRDGRETGTRELVVTGLPFLVVYQIMEDAVEILTVFHTARRPSDTLIS